MTKTPRRADGGGARGRTQAYAALLEKYLAAGGEAARGEAYETGRAAIADGLGVLEISAMHHDALAIVLQNGKGLVRRLKQAQELFGDALSPYEMEHRGFQRRCQRFAGRTRRWNRKFSAWHMRSTTTQASS